MPNAATARPDPSRPLPPGGTIGILGGGQLGRMLALAAARLGLKTHVYSDSSGPAFDVATAATIGAFDDEAALLRFAAAVDAVTYEFENVPVAAAEALARVVPVRPGAQALAVARDRLAEKRFIAALGIPVAPYVPVDSAADLRRGLARFAGPAILKTRRLGYDGKGQAALEPGADADAAFASIGGAPAVLERRVAFTREASVLAVRGLDGGIAFYDCPENTHRGGILRRSVVPSALTAAETGEARVIAGTIADALGYVGVLAVELFHFAGGADGGIGPRLMVNEIAPRVHNSGHWTSDACAVSQFENHIRAVAGWPLGATTRHSDAEMINLIGHDADAWLALAAEPGLALHLYGKRDARDGRKMGHATRLSPRS